MDDQLQARILERVQHALLHVDHIGGAGIVVDQPDQERAAESEAAGLRVRGEAQGLDCGVDALAGVALDEG